MHKANNKNVCLHVGLKRVVVGKQSPKAGSGRTGKLYIGIIAPC